MGKPVFRVTTHMVNMIVGISTLVGRLDVEREKRFTPKLRQVSKISTVYSTLAIEQNLLTREQVTAVLDGKYVFGPRNDVKAVQNAGNAYDMLEMLDPLSMDDLMRAHGIIMDGLIKENGVFRNEQVGVKDENGHVIHIAPSAHMVHELMYDLFDWYKNAKEPVLIKSAAFHYDFEFIHPFKDGNGRTGRFWHTALLGQFSPIFYWLPIEEMILEHQNEYYDAFLISNSEGDCTVFIEFMLELIYRTMKSMVV